MADLFNDYRNKNKTKKNFAIVTSALIFAFTINAFLFKTDTGRNLQTSVMNIWEKWVKSKTQDIYLEKAGTWILVLKLWNNLDSVSELRGSMLSDPENIVLTTNPEWVKNDFFTTNKAVLKNISNSPWANLINIKFEKPINLKKWTIVLYIWYEKTKIEAKTVINLAETNFVSNKETYELTNGSIEF